MINCASIIIYSQLTIGGGQLGVYSQLVSLLGCQTLVSFAEYIRRRIDFLPQLQLTFFWQENYFTILDCYGYCLTSLGTFPVVASQLYLELILLKAIPVLQKKNKQTRGRGYRISRSIEKITSEFSRGSLKLMWNFQGFCFYYSDRISC